MLNARRAWDVILMAGKKKKVGGMRADIPRRDTGIFVGRLWCRDRWPPEADPDTAPAETTLRLVPGERTAARRGTVCCVRKTWDRPVPTGLGPSQLMFPPLAAGQNARSAARWPPSLPREHTTLRPLACVPSRHRSPGRDQALPPPRSGQSPRDVTLGLCSSPRAQRRPRG